MMFLVVRKLFPRAKLVANVNINFKIICYSNHFPHFEWRADKGGTLPSLPSSPGPFLFVGGFFEDGYKKNKTKQKKNSKHKRKKKEKKELNKKHKHYELKLGLTKQNNVIFIFGN